MGFSLGGKPLLWTMLALSVSGAWADEPPPSSAPRVLALKPEGLMTHAHPVSVTLRSKCSESRVCSRLFNEDHLDQTESLTPGAFLRLSKGIGLGYRF
jgi:hypothetical protein